MALSDIVGRAAVVNRGSRATRVQAVLLDSKGDEVRRATLLDDLAPGAKLVALLDAAFAGLEGVAIRIECNEPSSLLLLRGTHEGAGVQLLYQTVPIAITPRR